MTERTLVGQGKTAKIYLLNGEAFKCFPINYPLDWIKYEVSIQNEIYNKTDLPILAYELIEQDCEIKMPFIKGIELTDRMRKERYKNGLEDLILLQKSIYEYSELSLQNAHDVFEANIQNSKLSNHVKQKALDSLYSIKRDNVLCHFDIHFSNIMFDGQKYYIIDWVNAKLANPILDVVRTYIILKQYVMRMAGKYLKTMAKELKVDIDDFKKAIPIMAALRMLENDVAVYHEQLLEMIDA